MIKAGRSQTTRPKTTTEIAKIWAIQDKGSASIQVRYKIRTLVNCDCAIQCFYFECSQIFAKSANIQFYLCNHDSGDSVAKAK